MKIKKCEILYEIVQAANPNLIISNELISDTGSSNLNNK
jgi:hypothetical protein